MTTVSVWGVDHGEEIAKAFSPSPTPKGPLVTPGMKRRGAVATLATGGGIAGAVLTRGKARVASGAVAGAGATLGVANMHSIRNSARTRGLISPSTKY